MTSKTKSNPAATSARFPARLTSIALLVLCHPSAHALQPVTSAHFEITPEFTPQTGQWEWFAYWIDDDLVTRKTHLNEVCFHGTDAPVANGGLRVTQPATSQWAFTGATPGETFWRFRDNTLTTPGLGANPSNMSNNAMTIALHSVQGPAGGFFSMYFSNSSPVPYLRTDNGIDGTDAFAKPLNHTHYNWAFTKKGLWIVNLTAQGILNATGQPTPVSPPQPIVFAIGDHALWKASSFSMTELLNPAISRDSADPDGDGWNNLMEYALGGDPHVASMRRASDGEALAPRLLPPAASGAPWHFSYHRRIEGNGLDVLYEVESSSNLAPHDWAGETGVENPVSSTGGWQEIHIPLASAQNRFFRLKVTAIP